MCYSEVDYMSIEKELIDELNKYLKAKTLDDSDKSDDNLVSLESFFED